MPSAPDTTLGAPPALPDVPAAGRPRVGVVQTVAFLGLLAVIAVVVIGLPPLLRLPRTPAPIRLAGLAGQVSGTYVTTTGGLYKLYPYPDLPAFPTVTATVAPASTIVVRARQLVQYGVYRLMAYPSRRAVATRVRRLDRGTIELVPRVRLAEGRYLIQTPADGADNEDDFFYFRVVAPTSSAVTLPG
jgi:hypothetical protein